MLSKFGENNLINQKYTHKEYFLLILSKSYIKLYLYKHSNYNL